MTKRKRKSKKKLNDQERLKDAGRWLQSRNCLKEPLVELYCKRYGVVQSDAWVELMSLGYYDELVIQQYEQAGMEWEYKVEPLSGDMFVVPTGTQDHELYEMHGLI